ncbi:MAG: hypothetical protein ACOY45_02330 [Pseudomonadota bacterium]
MGFDDLFRMMAPLFVAALAFVPLCRPPRRPPGAAPVEAHQHRIEHGRTGAVAGAAERLHRICTTS